MNKQRQGKRVAAFQANDLGHLQSPASHHQSKSPVSSNICPTCEKSFERLYNLKVHLRKHTGETPYDCPVNNCSKQFKWRSSMAHHVRAHHDPSELANTNAPVPTIRYPTSSTTMSRTTSSTKRREHKKTNTQGEFAVRSGGVKKPGKKNTLKSSVQSTTRLSLPPTVQTPENESGTGDDDFNTLREGESKDPFYLTPDSFIDDPILCFDEESEKIIESMSNILCREDGVRSSAGAGDVDGELKVEDRAAIAVKTEPEIHGIMDGEDELVADAVNEGLLFLAFGSEDATDAEMESLAQFEGHYVSPGTTSSGSPVMDPLILP